MGLANAGNNLQITVTGALLSFFMNGSCTELYVYTPGLFPTAVRATGSGVASAIGRLGAIASPIIVGHIYPLYGFTSLFGITTAVLLGGALSVLILGIPTSGRPLEAIAGTELQSSLLQIDLDRKS